MISVNVKLFAMIRDLAGTSSLSITLPERSSASTLMSALLDRYPQLSAWQHHIRIAVNREYVGHDYILTSEDEVAIIPPVSGG